MPALERDLSSRLPTENHMKEAERPVFWGLENGYKEATMEEMRKLASLPFLSFPGTRLLSKQLSAQALPEV